MQQEIISSSLTLEVIYRFPVKWSERKFIWL